MGEAIANMPGRGANISLAQGRHIWPQGRARGMQNKGQVGSQFHHIDAPVFRRCTDRGFHVLLYIEGTDI